MHRLDGHNDHRLICALEERNCRYLSLCISVRENIIVSHNELSCTSVRMSNRTIPDELNSDLWVTTSDDTEDVRYISTCISSAQLNTVEVFVLCELVSSRV